MSLPDELVAAIDDLYTVFAPYPFPAMMQASPLKDVAASWAAMSARPLRELTGLDLGQFAFSALSTWGMVGEFKHFLPRLLELTALGSLLTESEVVLGKLNQADWQTWPADEQSACKHFLASWWLSSMTEPERINDCLLGIVAADVPLEPYLAAWRAELAELCQVPSLAEALLAVWQLHGALLTRKNRLVTVPAGPRERELRHFLMSLYYGNALEDAFFNLSDRALAARLSELIVGLEWWLKRWPPTITLKSGLSAAEVETAFAIRRKIFADEQGIPAELDQDGADERGELVLAFVDDVAAGTGRITPAGPDQAQLSRIAVLRSYRGMGLGGRIVTALERSAPALGATTLTLQPHHYLQPFYERLGYRRIRGEDMIAGHRLITMIKSLAAV